MRKLHRTQKQRTLCRAVVTLLLLVLFWACLLWQNHPVFTAEGAVRSAETKHGTGETRILAQQTVHGITYTLSCNENTLLVTPFRFSLWPAGEWNQGYPELLLDLTREPGPVQAAAHAYTNNKGGWSHTQAAGLVDVPEAVSVSARIPSDSQDAPLTGEICTALNGQRYFWLWDEASPDPALHRYGTASLDLLDQNGRVLGTYEFFCGTSTSFRE